jgi:uncharacterized protein YjbI with pentapeptide repeats
MSGMRKVSRLLVAAGVGVAIWTALPGSSLGLVAGSSLNGSSLNGSSLNGSSLNGSSLNGSSLNGSSLN